MGSSAPTTTVTGSNAIAAGWIEAALTALDTGRSVLLSIADEPVPAIFQGPSAQVGVAAAFLVGGGGTCRVRLNGVSPGAALDPLQVLARVVEGALRDEASEAPLGGGMSISFSQRAARA